MINLNSNIKFKNSYFIKFFCLIIFLIFLKTFIEYEGNKVIYILFTLAFNFTLFKIILKKVYFFELFLGLLLWLGFWLKFSIFESNIYTSKDIFDGGFFCGVKLDNIDEILILSSLGCFGFLLSVFCFNFFSGDFNERKIIFNEKKKKFLFTLLVLFIIFYIFLIFGNVVFEIYQKGLFTTSEIDFLFRILYPFLYNIGFGSAVCFFVYYFHTYNYKYFYFIVALIIIEGFFTNVSMLSRNMILYSSSIFLGYVVLIKQTKKIEISNLKLLASFGVLLLFFILSIFTTNFQREIKFKNIEIDLNTETKLKNIEVDLETFLKCEENKNISIFKRNNFLELFLARSIGIEGVIMTQSNKNLLGFDLLKETLKEKNESQMSFYEKTFFKSKDRTRKYENSNQIILPGIIGYLNFSGSKIFVFLAMYVITYIFLIFEKVTVKMTSNYVLASFLSFVIVWRLINFGFLVTNTFYFILSIIVSFLTIYLLKLYLVRDGIKK